MDKKIHFEEFDIEHLSKVQLVNLYAAIEKKLKLSHGLRTNNITGELGESMAIQFFNNSNSLPNLSAAQISCKSYDAIDSENRKYSIKTIKGKSKTTSVFYGLEKKGKPNLPKPLFDFVLIVVLDENYSLIQIYQLNWNHFNYFKKWHSRMTAWNLNITLKLIHDDTIVKLL